MLPDQEQPEFDSLPQEAAPAAAPAAETKRLEKAQPRVDEVQKMQRMQETKPAKASGLPTRSEDSDASAALELGESMPEEAERRVRQHSVSDLQAPASVPVSSPAADLAQEVATERYCDESETADPNAWLECILELERQGLLDAARLERELLVEAFPPPELP